MEMPRQRASLCLGLCWIWLICACDDDRECDSHFRSDDLSATDGICTGDPGVFKYCDSTGGGQFSESAASTRWVRETCPGVEPVCTPLDRSGREVGHTCADAFEGEPCEAAELLPPPTDQGLVTRDEFHAVDIDQDGDLDLVFLADRDQKRGAQLWVALQAAALDFSDARKLVEYGVGAFRLSVGQVDGQGWLDAAAQVGDGTELVLLGVNGDLERTTFDESVVGLADVDDDGLAEAFVKRGAALDIHHDFLGTQRRVDRAATEVTERWSSVHGVHLGGDGRLDLVATWGLDAALLLATTAGYERVWEGTAVLGDLDGDAVADAVLPTLVRLGVGTGEATAEVPIPSTAYGGFQFIGDVDGDGHADVVEAMYPPDADNPLPNTSASVLLGDGTGQLGDPTVVKLAADSFDVIELVDLDGDGRADLLGVDGSGSVRLARGACLP